MAIEPLAYTVDEAVRATRVGRHRLYQAVRAGELRVVRVGRRIVVPVDELRVWLTRLSQTDTNG